jgi:hypothetical protein
MAGLVPAIHAFPNPETTLDLLHGTAWITGTSPVMTMVGVRRAAFATPARR